MGTCKFVLDVIQSYIDNKIPEPLINHVYFEYNETNICISTDDVYISKTYFESQDDIILRIIPYNDNTSLMGNREDYSINITKNAIELTNVPDEKIIFTSSTDGKDLFFNISLEHNLILTLDELKKIQRKFIELVKLKKHMQFRIFYTLGEEKKYGY